MELSSVVAKMSPGQCVKVFQKNGASRLVKMESGRKLSVLLDSRLTPYCEGDSRIKVLNYESGEWPNVVLWEKSLLNESEDLKLTRLDGKVTFVKKYGRDGILFTDQFEIKGLLSELKNDKQFMHPEQFAYSEIESCEPILPNPIFVKAKFKYLLQQVGMTQHELAHWMGFTQAAVSKALSGNGLPSGKFAALFIKVLQDLTTSSNKKHLQAIIPLYYALLNKATDLLSFSSQEIPTVWGYASVTRGGENLTDSAYEKLIEEWQQTSDSSFSEFLHSEEIEVKYVGISQPASFYYFLRVKGAIYYMLKSCLYESQIWISSLSDKDWLSDVKR